ncbi:hydrolase [Vibrio salinus]|uniref:hydrolase n=1 Tax=Vibrio salinus TaxID=2899784 RepID=UPI0035629C3F
MPAFQSAQHYSNTHIQTVLPKLLRRTPLFSPFWQTLPLPDNDFLDIAWSEAPHRTTSTTRPIFILFHGLEGHFSSPYANGLMHAFSKQGWLSVMMHFRGCSGRSNNYARAYHSGQIQDTRFFIESIHNRFPENPKVAVGVSLGGNMLANYLSQYENDTFLNGAAIISAPFELSSCSNRVNRGVSKIYQNYLLHSLKRNALNKADLIHQALKLSKPQIKAIKTLREFDNLLTAPLHHFKDAEDYYHQCSAISKIHNIRIPSLIIHSKDDPFMDSQVVLSSPLPEHIHYYLTEHGGHVGFVEKHNGKLNLWLERSLPLYFDSLLNKG